MEEEKAGKPAADSGAVWCPAVEGIASTPAAKGDGDCLGAGAGVELEPWLGSSVGAEATGGSSPYWENAFNTPVPSVKRVGSRQRYPSFRLLLPMPSHCPNTARHQLLKEPGKISLQEMSRVSGQQTGSTLLTCP